MISEQQLSQDITIETPLGPKRFRIKPVDEGFAVYSLADSHLFNSRPLVIGNVRSKEQAVALIKKETNPEILIRNNHATKTIN